MGKILNLHTPANITLVCTKVNRSTDEASCKIRRYDNAKYDSIYKAYKKPSCRKVDAFHEILKEMSNVKGYDMRITGAGCDVFSCAYRVKDGSGVEYIIYHTPTNRYCVVYRDPTWIENNSM